MREQILIKKPKYNFNALHINQLRLSIIDECPVNSNGARLLIQGLACEAETIWRSLIVELFKQGDTKRIIAMDVRGIGYSSGWPDSFEQIVDDYASVLTKLNIDSVEVVGHSLGGIIAILLADKYPSLVKSLVLMDVIPAYNEKSRSGFLWRAERIRLTGKVSIIFDKVIPRSFGEEAKIKKSLMIESFKSMLSRQSPDVYSHLCQLTAEVNAWPQFDLLKLPIKFIAGNEDKSTTPEIMKSLLRNKNETFIVIPNAGHNPPLEQPALVAKALLNTD